jgi:hypothetical protein
MMRKICVHMWLLSLSQYCNCVFFYYLHTTVHQRPIGSALPTFSLCQLVGKLQETNRKLRNRRSIEGGMQTILFSNLPLLHHRSNWGIGLRPLNAWVWKPSQQPRQHLYVVAGTGTLWIPLFDRKNPATFGKPREVSNPPFIWWKGPLNKMTHVEGTGGFRGAILGMWTSSERFQHCSEDQYSLLIVDWTGTLWPPVLSTVAWYRQKDGGPLMSCSWDNTRSWAVGCWL